MVDESLNRLKNLDLILKKTENLLFNLDQSGLDVSKPSLKLKVARRLYSENKVEDALKILEETITELQRIKHEYNRVSVESPGRGKGVYALFRTDDTVGRKQMEEWKLLLESWRDEGYRIGDLKEIFSREPEELERTFVEISKNVAKSEKYQKDIKKILKDPKLPSELRVQFQNLLPKLKNIVDFNLIEKKVQELMEEYREYLNYVKEAGEKINSLKAEGYNVEAIESSFRRDSYDVFKEKYRTFLKSIEMLKNVEEKLKAIEGDQYLGKTLGNKAREIRRLLKNPGKIGEVQRLIKPLLEEVKRKQEEKKKVLEERAIRGNIIEEIDLWEREGLDVDELRKNVNAPLEKLKELRDRFVEGTEKIKELKRKLLTLDGVGYENEIASLALGMNSPLKADDYAEQVKELVERVEERNRVLSLLKKKAKYWRKLGYLVTPIEKFLQNPGRLEESIEYLQTYQNNFQRAITIENELKSVKNPQLKKMAEEITLLLKNLSDLKPALQRYEELKKLMKRETVLKEKWKEFNEVSRSWMKKGYRIQGVLERFLRVKNSPEEIDRLLEEYRQRIKELEELRKEFSTIPKGIARALEVELEEMLKDPESLEEARKKLMLLKTRVANQEHLKKKLEIFIEKMEKRGVDVTTIRRKMEENPTDIRTLAEEFKDKLKEFAKVKKEILSRLRKEGRVEELNDLKKINDPYRLDELIERYSPFLKAQTLSDHQNIESLLNMAHQEYKKKNYDRALELYRRVLEMDPDNRRANFFIKRINFLKKGEVRGKDR